MQEAEHRITIVSPPQSTHIHLTACIDCIYDRMKKQDSHSYSFPLLRTSEKGFHLSH